MCSKKYLSQIIFLLLIFVFSAHCANSFENNTNKPYLMNHADWINDPKRQKPPNLLGEQKEKWKPPLLKVKTSLHFNNLYDLNHKNQTFSLQGTLSFSWDQKIKGWHGDEDEQIWVNFNSIKNYDFKKTEWYEPYIDANGNKAVSIGFDGNFSSNFNYKKFPFDDQVLNIEYEPDTDAYEIIFQQEKLPTLENNFNMILDYNISDMTVENKIKVYPTNFGVADYEIGETYSSSLVRTSISLKKSFVNSFLIYIAPLLLIALLLLINASRLSFDKGVKLSLPPASLVAIIFLQNDLNQTLPKLSYLTYLHYLYIYSYVLVFICFLEAIFSFNEKFNQAEKSIYFIRRNSLIILMNLIIFILPTITYFII